MQERIQRLLVELGRLRQEYKDVTRRSGTAGQVDKKVTLISDKEAELDAAKAEFERKTGRPWE